VEPLFQRRVLASELDNLLGYNTSKEGSHGSDTGLCIQSSVSNYILI
jgi:hypothetical protein